MQAVGDGGTESLAVFVGIDGGGVGVVGEVVPVCAVGGELWVDAFFEDFAVEEDGFVGLFIFKFC